MCGRPSLFCAVISGSTSIRAFAQREASEFARAIFSRRPFFSALWKAVKKISVRSSLSRWNCEFA